VPLGRIPILGYLVEKADKDNVRKPFPFKLEHAGVCRTWYFSTSGDEERDFWIGTINGAIHYFVSSGKVMTEREKEKEEFELEDDDDDIPETQDSEIVEQEKILKEQEEKMALEEALLLDEEDRMKQEEEILNLHEEEISLQEYALEEDPNEKDPNEKVEETKPVLISSPSFATLEPPPSYTSVMDIPQNYDL